MYWGFVWKAGAKKIRYSLGSALGPGILLRLLTQDGAVGLSAIEEGLSVFSGFCFWETCMQRNVGKLPGAS